MPEWPGKTSAKFTTNRKHVPHPDVKDQKHPLFDMAGRKHYEEKRSNEWQFKTQKKFIVPIDHDKHDK